MQTPAAVSSSEQRDIVKEQQERQHTAVLADVVNDAPREYLFKHWLFYKWYLLTSHVDDDDDSGAAPATGAHLQAGQDSQLVRKGRHRLLARRL